MPATDLVDGVGSLAGSEPVRVRLLGPVDITRGGVALPVRGLRRKSILAVLGLHLDRAVSADWLIDVVWGQCPPATVANTLQRHISYLRGLLGARTAIRSRPPGYLLDTPVVGTDVALARRLVEQGGPGADPAERAAELRAALGLWRGPSLSDVAAVSWLAAQADQLEDLRLSTVLGLIEARMALGQHAEVVPELVLLAQQHPFREQIHGQLMLALYRAGRQVEALAAFQRIRHTMVTELGVDPGTALRDLETAILRQDAALDPVEPAITLVPAVAGWAAPRQLPLAIPSIVGRVPQLAQLDGILASKEQRAGPRAVTVAAVTGTAGVGKTALALYWAHRVADQFPDGHLYVNLRGFDPGGTPMHSAEAVRGFLDAFGVPAARVPASVQAQTALYRSLLAGRRVLVVLDNARDVEQVRPLLPGSPEAMVIVTSRDQLTALIAIEGAATVPLGVLDSAEAVELLATRLGAERAAREPDATREVVAGCAGLPLALVVAGARATARPHFPLTVLARELREAGCALDPLHGGDIATDVRAVFSWSYQALSPAAARLFRLLGLHPGAEASAAAAASLAGIPADHTQALLSELTRAHLLAEHRPGRYTAHDLLRAYAVEQVSGHDSADMRDAAIHRLLDHYLHAGYAAARLLEPCLDPMTPMAPRPGVTVNEPITAHDALSWFTTEHHALLAAIQLAAKAEYDTHAWQLAWTATSFLVRCGYWQDQESAQHAALAAAGRLNDLAGQAHARRGLGQGYALSGRLADAHAQLLRAFELFGALGDHVNQASVHLRLGWIADRRDRPAEALSHAQRAHDLFHDADHHAARGWVLKDLGRYHTRLHNHQQALACGEQAIAVSREAGDAFTEAGAWEGVGHAHLALINHARAITCYQRAIDLYRQLGSRRFEAETLSSLGEAYHAAADPHAAREAWLQALHIFDDLQHPHAQQVRAKLRQQSGSAGHRFTAQAVPR